MAAATILLQWAVFIYLFTYLFGRERGLTAVIVIGIIWIGLGGVFLSNAEAAARAAADGQPTESFDRTGRTALLLAYIVQATAMFAVPIVYASVNKKKRLVQVFLLSLVALAASPATPARAVNQLIMAERIIPMRVSLAAEARNLPYSEIRGSGYYFEHEYVGPAAPPATACARAARHVFDAFDRADFAWLEFVHRAFLRPDNYVPADQTANTAIFRYYASKLLVYVDDAVPVIDLRCGFDDRALVDPGGVVASVDYAYGLLITNVLVGLVLGAAWRLAILILSRRRPV
ncbi:MAG TPA: hypothetical protein DHW63_04735 [Hyphomonadaceae bacterium]|nr:hypothetical protein [Hyphomonadaceae bacterium]